MNGVLIIDKPEDWTSHDVIARCRRILKTKRIGHTGTLDPFATGVLVVLVGKATRLARFLDKDEKEYEAVVQLGFETETGDRTGRLKDEGGRRKTEVSKVLENVDWEEVLSEFRGEIEQMPPMYSAKKIKGKKLYELAREGVEIKREPVKIKIHDLEIIKDQRSKIKDQRSIRVSCSAGTYIRTLAEDIGKKIGVGAHLAELRRIRAGKFSIENAVTLEELAEMAENEEVENILVSPGESVSHLPEVILNDEEVKKTVNGMKLFCEKFTALDGQAVRMADKEKNLVAVGFYSVKDGFIQPRVVVI
jgi:tRNA pseudouridine55 synthase